MIGGFGGRWTRLVGGERYGIAQGQEAAGSRRVGLILAATLLEPGEQGARGGVADKVARHVRRAGFQNRLDRDAGQRWRREDDQVSDRRQVAASLEGGLQRGEPLLGQLRQGLLPGLRDLVAQELADLAGPLVVDLGPRPAGAGARDPDPPRRAAAPDDAGPVVPRGSAALGMVMRSSQPTSAASAGSRAWI